jgi:diguanylate cyclase (GGDEF)-like protein/PAS domain S-box-containing protein
MTECAWRMIILRAMSDDVISFRTPWTTTLEPSATLERRLAEQRLQAEQLQLLGTAVHVSAHGIAILTPAVEAEGPRIAFVNDGFCTLFGRGREEIIGQTPVAFGIVDRQAAISASLLQHVFEHRAFAAEATARRKDGSEFELDLELVPVVDAGALTHWVAFVRDISAEKSQVTQLRYQAMHDGLTNLPNRTMLYETLNREIDLARDAKGSLALLLMDLDRFKEVNDTFGHQFGDLLLQQVAFRLRNQLKESDTVARLGGDEFAILLGGAMDSTDVARTARNILNALEQPVIVDGQVLEIGASIGIALYPTHGTDARMLLRRADVAMYAAKQAQTGYSFHRDENETKKQSADQLSLVVEMRHALERNELEPFFQPKLHMRSGLMTRAEVLLRWNHPQRGQISPSVFVPIAERTGLIRTVTDWLLERALAQVHAWREAGAPIHIAVNISAKSLLDQALPAKIHSILTKWDVDPRFLKIEITESSIMADPAHALAVMSMLQSMGVRLSVDDFGTGYSSLTHLRQLPIDEIKIDKSFVSNMTTSEADAAIVRTVIDLGHNLGKQVCAEGVEDEATWNMLRDLGCDLAQGFWISKPVTATELMDWLVKSSWGLHFGHG